MPMLFRKKMPRACIHCIHGTKLNENEILCKRKGIVAVEHCCRKFEYDPCKRIPMKMKTADLSKYNSDDYTL